MMPTGQLDLFTSAPIEVPAAPVTVRRQAPLLGLGEVRYTRSRAGRDCDDCSAAQAAARSGGPVPFRRRTAWLRKTSTTSTFLCEAHKAGREAADRIAGLREVAR